MLLSKPWAPIKTTGRYLPIGTVCAASIEAAQQTRSESELKVPAFGSSRASTSLGEAHVSDAATTGANVMHRSDMANAQITEERINEKTDTLQHVLPVAHSLLLSDLRKAVLLVNDETSANLRRWGMHFGEGSFAVQYLCGVIEQLFGHALRSGK